MRKTALIAMVALVLLFHSPPVPAKASHPDLSLDVFRGKVGRIAFALPGVPQWVLDHDYPGLWINSVQLFGNAADGAEFQLRTADIGEWIQAYKEAYPQANPQEWKVQALFSYAMFMIKTFEGEINNPAAFEEDGLVYASFDYAYPDAPGQAYRGKAILDGSLAVSLTGAVSGQTDKAFDLLTGLSEAEAASQAAPANSPWSMGSLSAVFPGAVHEQETGQSLLAACFAEDFSFMQIEAFARGARLPGKEGDALRDELILLAKRVMLPGIHGQSISNPMVSRPARDMVALDFTSVNTEPLGEEYGQRFLGRLYLGERGVYYIWAADTATGQAFMDNLAISPAE